MSEAVELLAVDVADGDVQLGREIENFLDAFGMDAVTKQDHVETSLTRL